MDIDYSNQNVQAALDCSDDWHRMARRCDRAIRSGDTEGAKRMATVLRLVAEDLGRYADSLVGSGNTAEASYVFDLLRRCDSGTDGVYHAIRNMA